MRFPRAFLSILTVAAVSATIVAAPAQAFQTAEAVDATEVVAKAGKAIYTADGKKLASIYKVTADGSAQLFLNSRMFTVPASTLTLTDGKIVTSLSKRDVMNAGR